MKNKLVIIGFLSLLSLSFTLYRVYYDEDYVQISTVKYDNYQFQEVYLNRGGSNKRIKAKYFAAKDYNGTSVSDRYAAWSQNKNVICVTSGTYMSDCNGSAARPIGLTIDNGKLVNRNIEDFDGLVIVYATGGIVATNLDDKNLKVQGGSISGIPLDLRGNSYHLSEFIKWSEEYEATVFQTHLLVYNNSIKISSRNSSSQQRERRFLSVGYNDENELVHCIIHSPESTTLYEGTRRVLKFLNEFEEMNVVYMVNLDTGCQNIFEVRNSDGSVNKSIAGSTSINNAANLLVYYYE